MEGFSWLRDCGFLLFWYSYMIFKLDVKNSHKADEADKARSGSPPPLSIAES